jgi:hypothetical protein
MNTIKTTALTFFTIVACLVLLMLPDSYRDEAQKGDAMPALQESSAISRPQIAFQFEPDNPAAPIYDETLPIEQDIPQPILASTPVTQSTNWPMILYPELIRIETLENQPVYTALGDLVPMLSNDDPVIRLAAIESLGDMTNPAALSALTSALNDPNPQLRVAALGALASQEDESVAGSLEPFLYDQDREVRLAAIGAISDLESEASVYALAGLLSDSDPRIRQQAVDALGEIGGKNAMMYLQQARYDPSSSIREDVETMLSELARDLAN